MRLNPTVCYASAIVLFTGWLQVATFQNLLTPPTDRQSDRLQSTRFLSGAVCQDELIFLVDIHPPSNAIDWTDDRAYAADEFRCNLRTGVISSSPASPDVRHLVSDGQTLWRLPHDGRVHHPIVWCGRLVDMATSDHRLYRLVEFAEGEWRETDDYPLMPLGYPGFPAMSPAPGITTIPMLSFIRNDANVRYNPAVAVGTREQVVDFLKRLPDDRNRHPDANWQQTAFDANAFPSFHRPFGLDDVSIGIWFEGSGVCALKPILDGNQLAAFEFHLSSDNRSIGTKRVRSPIRWARGYDLFFGTTLQGWIETVATSSGDVFVISYDGEDGRMHVLKWNGAQLRLVAQRGSPLTVHECSDVGAFLRDAILVPTALLGLLIGLVLHRRGCREFQSAREAIPLASLLRRGIARVIDLSLPVAILLASVILHPDVTGWWLEVKSLWWQIVPSTSTPLKPPLEIADLLGKLFWELTSVPSLPHFYLMAILILVLQTIVQGRTGRTLGKWLLGIKVVRTTLRPCGIANSLLREILLVLDSVMLLSWIPGVVSILATRNAQRIGDLFAGTVVVRDIIRE